MRYGHLVRQPENVRKGARVVIACLHDYKLVQDRPFQCRTACVCGECNGFTTEHPGTVTNVMQYADNSKEAHVRCDDGNIRRVMLSPPSGD